MPYSDIVLIRNVSGLTTAEKSDADLTALITIADKIIDDYTGQSWVSSDSGYQQVTLASALLVSWLASLSLAGGQDKAEAFKKAAYGILDNLLVRGKVV
jgi:hypothetical protein